MVNQNDSNLLFVRDSKNNNKVYRVFRPLYDGYEIIVDNEIVFRRANELYYV